MKRKMVELVDAIHAEERADLEENLDYIKPEMTDWQKKCVEPVNFEVAVFNKMQHDDQKKKRREKWEELHEHNDNRKESAKRLESLSELC